MEHRSPARRSDDSEAVAGARRLHAGQRAEGRSAHRDRTASGARRGYRAAGRPTSIVSTLDMSTPVFAELSAASVRASSPAPHRSMTVIATWQTTSACRMRGACVTRTPFGAGRRRRSIRARPAAPERCRRRARSASTGPACRPTHACRPRGRAHAADPAARTQRAHRGSRAPVATPSAPPAADSITLSTTSCRTIATRPAPSDVRIAISRRRAAPLARSRLATLKQAIDSSTPTAPNSTSSDVCTRPVSSSRSGTSSTLVRRLNS